MKIASALHLKSSFQARYVIRPYSITLDRELLFLLVYSIYSFTAVLSSSLFAFASVLSSLVMYASCGVLVFLWFLQKQFDTKRILLHIIIVVVMCLAVLTTGRKNLLLFSLFIINAGAVDVNKIARTSIVATFSATCLVILSCKAGVLPDRVYYHEGALAHSLGFSYYGSYPYIIMFNMLAYLYVRKKLHWVEIIAFVLLNNYIYYNSTLRLTYYLSLFVVLLYVVMIKMDFVTLNRKLYRRLSLLVFPGFFLFTIIGSLKYNSQRRWWRELNDLLSGRLYLSKIAFQRYHVKPFGQFIETNNMINGRIVTTNYFYIDSGYIYAILGYGLVFTLLLLAVYSFLIHYSCRTNDKKLFVWLLSLAIFTVVNNVWVSVHYNCLLLMLMPFLNDASLRLQKKLQEVIKFATKT